MEIKGSKYESNSYKIRLHILSPVHIGCDDVYEPTSFVIDEGRKKLIEFDPFEFVNSLDNNKKQEFIRLCSGENILSIMKFIKNNSKNIKGREISIATGLVEHYKKVVSMSTFDKNIVINQFTINKTAYNPNTKKPYIPGSSVKGSLRTAYLNIIAEKKKLEVKNRNNPRELEEKLLGGKFDTDPFSYVKVTDFLPVGEINTKIIYAVNRRKKNSKRSNLYQIFEVVPQGAIFEGNIIVTSPLKKLNLSIDPNSLFTNCHNFYAEIMENEASFYKLPLSNHINDVLKKERGSLIRIGHHSGAESVTIKGFRNIEILQGKNKKPKFLDHSTTIWLASDSKSPSEESGLLPFGWAVLEIVN